MTDFEELEKQIGTFLVDVYPECNTFSHFDRVISKIYEILLRHSEKDLKEIRFSVNTAPLKCVLCFETGEVDFFIYNGW